MFRLINHGGRAALVVDEQRFDLATLSGDAALSDPMVALARHRELHELSQRAGSVTSDGPVDPGALLAPVPQPAKVFAIGLNYREHAAESNIALAPAPMTFTKFQNSICAPGSDIALSGDTVDWEVELVVVIGDRCRNVARDDAWNHVAGLTLGQDISDRTVQLIGAPAQFSLGKSFDTYGPIGPAVVSVDAFTDREQIGLWCDVSGRRVQTGNTRDQIFPIPQLVSYLSSICTLEAGDIIFTGTPSGVGMASGTFLKVGDEIVSGADVIGGFTNRCVAGSGPVL